MINKNNKPKFFYCYSINLMTYFKNNGLDPYITSIHPVSKNTCWTYRSGRILDMLREEYNAMKNK